MPSVEGVECEDYDGGEAGTVGDSTLPPLRSCVTSTAEAGCATIAAQADLMSATLQTRTVAVNGIQMHIAEQGSGPLAICCHGWPELGYSWRHQIPALVSAGYRVVVPDMRGFGKTDAPPDIDQYSIFHMVGDIVALVHAVGEKQAVIIGHDWGAPVAWNTALPLASRSRETSERAAPSTMTSAPT